VTQDLCPITNDRIDPEAAKIVRRLVKHDYEAYLVGGCVRDLLLGLRPKDYDVATSATPTEIRALFRNSRIIGRRFRLAHIFFGPKIIETATFRAEPLKEDEPADDDDPLIWRDNAFGTAVEDARRRDLTINGLFYDLVAHRVLDWVGGLDDLRARRVRTIGDPQVRLSEDPVRILRVVKFAVRLGLTIDPATEEAILAHRGLIERCSVARVLEEIYRLLGGGHAKPAFALLQRLGVLPVLFPELSALVGPAERAEAREPVPVIGLIRRSRRPGAVAEVPPVGDDEITETTLALAGSGEGFADEARIDALWEAVGLRAPRAREQAVTELWAHLEALDELVARATEAPAHPLLLAALLAGPAHEVFGEQRRATWSLQQIDLLAAAIGGRLQVSRRDRERLKQIMAAQRRLTEARPRRQLVQRDYFADAYRFLELRQRATGSHAEALERWIELLGDKQQRRRQRRRPSRSGAPGGSDAAGGAEPGAAADGGDDVA
jgi:poly(A) polymerase